VRKEGRGSRLSCLGISKNAPNEYQEIGEIDLRKNNMLSWLYIRLSGIKDIIKNFTFSSEKSLLVVTRFHFVCIDLSTCKSTQMQTNSTYDDCKIRMLLCSLSILLLEVFNFPIVNVFLLTLHRNYNSWYIFFSVHPL
jgi:hypothetical protein